MGGVGNDIAVVRSALVQCEVAGMLSYRHRDRAGAPGGRALPGWLTFRFF